jgi:hypothetical protein
MTEKCRAMNVHTKKKAPLDLAMFAADADTLPHHVDGGDDQSKERPEEDDDVPRSPFGQHQRSVQPDDQG